jgi:tryptophan-rich sensory protein
VATTSTRSANSATWPPSTCSSALESSCAASSSFVTAEGAAFPLAIYVSARNLSRAIDTASWSPIFFGMRRPDLAFIEVVMLWLSIIATIAAFHRVNTVAAWLLLPYLAWVTFAAALNLTIWRLNRGPLSQS